MTNSKKEFEKIQKELETVQKTYKDLIASNDEVHEMKYDDVDVNEDNLPEICPEFNLDTDFQYSHDSIHQTLEIARNSMKQLSEIAACSKHPRAFEVLALLAKTITDSSKSLLELYKQQQDIENPKNIDAGKINTQNNLFVGSTSELDKILSKLNKKQNA